MWQAQTLEDHLLGQYLDENPGDLFVELAVGTNGPTYGQRRIDGVLVPGERKTVHATYSVEKALQKIAGREVHLLEAKRSLNRNVIGQVEVGTALLERDFRPASIVPVAVCIRRNKDLEWYCDSKGILVEYYDVEYYDVSSDLGPETKPPIEGSDGRIDVRKPPSPSRRTAFLGGWSDAVQGRLYRSIRFRKTHANMGNLFGWIYGSQPDEFRNATWQRYIDRLGDLPHESEGEE